MVKQVINVGVEGNDASGDSIRAAFEKSNNNFNELYSYAGKGDGLSFTQLTDTPSTLVPNDIFIVNAGGDKIVSKKLVAGAGISIDNTDPNNITLYGKGGRVFNDTSPVFGGNVDANKYAIANLGDPTELLQTTLGYSMDTFAISRGYADNRYVNVTGDIMTGALQVPEGAVGAQVPRKEEVVGRSGGTDNSMSGPLILNADPTEISDPLTAATKNYVDNNAFSSSVNLFVSTNGDDFRNEISESKRGRALAYAFKTINQAAFKAGQIIDNAANELGPYQKTIYYNSGTTKSTVSSITQSGDHYLLKITNGHISTGTDMRGTGSIATSDVRSGLLIRGLTSGAIASIVLVGNINTDGTESYQVKYTNFDTQDPPQPIPFLVGENLEYGDPVKQPNITIYVESGEYFENYPIRLPNNVSLVGDDLRRVIIRPKPGPSGSIWSNTYFRRDTTIDGMTVVTQNFGYHYLTDSTMELYSKTVNSPGGSINAKSLLYPNKEFIQVEIIGYINYRIQNANALNLTTDPYYYFTYDETKYQTYVGSIVNALCFDLEYGGYSKTFEAVMSFYSNPVDLKLVTDQLVEASNFIGYMGVISSSIIGNTPVTHSYQSSINQTINLNITAETTANITISNLITLILDVINSDESFNMPKDNNQMDVLMLNDSNRVRTLSGQGHGGFMCVLDPAGQILTKSPYIQQCSSFSKSINAQTFAGGVFVDAFTGNLGCTITSRDSATVIQVSGLNYRIPQTPCSFVVSGVRFEIDYISNYVPWNKDTETGGTAQLNLNINTPDNISYTGLLSNLLNATTNIEIQTAGNRSMLASDFTQINDMGYGIFVTNNAFFEAVSIFCYYNYRAFYALNGAQIRSLNGSCGYGVYALNAEGSDPTEIPYGAVLKNNMIQTAKIYSQTSLSTKNKKGDLIIYISSTSYVPFNISELEIDHGGGVFVRYDINSASVTGLTASDSSAVYAMNINTSGNSDTSTSGLYADVADGTDVIIRNLQNFEVLHLTTITPTRPSTALQFNNDSSIYHVLSYTPKHLDDGLGTADLAAVLTISESYAYVKMVSDSSAGIASNSGEVGATRINISALVPSDIAKIHNMVFAWGSRVHQITSYETPAQTGYSWGRITFTTFGGVSGLSKTTSASAYGGNSVVIKAGLPASTSAQLTVQISVMRATGHDLVDIGTGSYADSNIPANIYGGPVNAKKQANEVQEIGKGRVFYVSTDQDGNFRIGKFFRVDQGTGTVTFAASIALSNLDGIGFKRGVAVSEFSTDDTMTNNATDTVPTQSAIVGYIDKRLGITYPGNGATINPLGPGFMPRDGSLSATADMNMGSYHITNLEYPRDDNDTDAANKGYVDQFMKRSGGIRSGIDSFTMSSTTVINVTYLSRTTNVGTVFVNTPHALSIGSVVVIAGTSLSGFDGARTVISVVDLLTFTCASTGIDVNTGASVGTVTIPSSIGLNGNKVTGSADPTDLHDLVNKNYVDNATIRNLSSLNDVTITTPALNNLLYYNGSKWINASVTGDVTFTLSGSTVTSSIGNNKVTNAMLSSTAAIDQSKLNLNLSTAASTAGTAVQGISSFNNSFFNVISGYVSLKDGGITLSKLANIGNGSVIGNNSGTTGTPSEVTFSAIVQGGGALYGGLFPGTGVLAKTSSGVYSVVGYGTTSTANTLVLRDTSGNNNADTAAKLTTPRKINGVNFDGTSDIVIASAAANSLTFGTHLTSGGSSYNGSLAVTISTDATDANTAGTIVARDSSGNFSAGIITATATKAEYADLAEYYEADKVYEAGTVLMLGGDKEVTLAKGFGTTKVIGIVSTNPAHLMNTGCKGEKVAIALQGRVPCKVIGRIEKGDILQVGLVPGVASVATQPTPGCIIGKALENYDSDRIGVIEVVVGKH